MTPFMKAVFEKYPFDTAVDILFAQARLRTRLHIDYLCFTAHLALKYNQSLKDMLAITNKRRIY